MKTHIYKKWYFKYLTRRWQRWLAAGAFGYFTMAPLLANHRAFSSGCCHEAGGGDCHLQNTHKWWDLTMIVSPVVSLNLLNPHTASLFSIFWCGYWGSQRPHNSKWQEEVQIPAVCHPLSLNTLGSVTSINGVRPRVHSGEAIYKFCIMWCSFSQKTQCW